MATHTIGTGGDFSTPQAWEDDIPDTLIADRIGQVKNEEITYNSGYQLTISAKDTTSGEIILEAVSGGGWNEHANVATNRYAYIGTNGASLNNTTDGFHVIRFTDGATDRLTVRNLQLKQQGGRCVNYSEGFTGDHIWKNLICESISTGDSIFDEKSDEAIIVNCLFVNNGTGGNGITNNGLTLACTIVRPSNHSAAGKGLDEDSGGTKLVKDTAIFGFTQDAENTFDSASDYNATPLSDVASSLPDPASDHNQYSVAYTTATFVQPSNASSVMDFRPVAAGALENTGIYDGTNSPSDAALVVRGNPPEIGARELAATGRTTKNTRAGHLGIEAGMGWRMST